MRRTCGGFGRFALLVRLPQHPPRDIWAQLFAAHAAAGSAFDQGAVLRRYPMAHPALHGLIALDTEGAGRADGSAQQRDRVCRGLGRVELAVVVHTRFTSNAS